MSNFILAISGGVDSVVLLDVFAKKPELNLIVAHFDHGIRPDSADDAKFVEDLAKKYQLPFVMKAEKLGESASEDLARRRRYCFLRDLAKKHHAKIVTAHHADDVVETVAINLSRGTGWRGLASMDSDIIRPFVDITKHEIIDYANNRRLQWREDSTNGANNYLRNQIRIKLKKVNDDEKRQILGLWSAQKSLKKQINAETKRLIGDGPEYSRYFFTHIDETSAMECLRTATKELLTRPQLKKAIYAIKTAKPQKVYQAGSGVLLKFSSRIFTVELIK